MDSKFGNRLMIAALAVGFVICVGYSLSSSHLHKGKDPSESSSPATSQ
ncbi:hypothetical protein [Neorhizobium sp. P12A]|nr:hypothetical protein [Neorhizobium sp. P12A]